MSKSDSLSVDRPNANHRFHVDAPFDPAGDQLEAIEALARGFREGVDVQTPLGVIGSGKANTVSWVVEEVQKSTLVPAYNKTLAAQLYEEFKGLFPDNAVEYLVSYYDYYQPEAYIEQTDTYIDKDMSINEEIDRLRYPAIRSLLTRDDVIVVASVLATYGLGDPKNYTDTFLRLEVGQGVDRDGLLRVFVDPNYECNDVDLQQGASCVRGDTVEVLLMYGRYAVRIESWDDEIDRMLKLDPLEGEVKPLEPVILVRSVEHYSILEEQLKGVISEIEGLMEQRVKHFQRQGDLVAAQRIEERTTFDTKMFRETGHCSGIENCSVHLSDRGSGDASYTLLDYLPDDFPTVIDESHVTLPQIKGQYADDKSRRDSLVRNDFRPPTVYDNRPLTSEEFEETVGQTLSASTTSGDYECEHSDQIVEQTARSTHLVDPKVEVTEATRQVDDLMARIDERIDRGERVLVTMFTKRMAEDLIEYLEKADADVAYMYDEIDTLERHESTRSLCLGDIGVPVGANLLREGLDIPEVSLAVVLDADQQGFLYPETTFVQTMGRVARNVNGEAVFYANGMTDAMEAAISEMQRRCRIQQEFNKEYGYTSMATEKEVDETNLSGSKTDTRGVSGDESADVDEAVEQITFLEDRMQEAADNFEFELVADIHDCTQNLRREFDADAFEDGIASGHPDEHDGKADDGLTPLDEF